MPRTPPDPPLVTIAQSIADAGAAAEILTLNPLQDADAAIRTFVTGNLDDLHVRSVGKPEQLAELIYAVEFSNRRIRSLGDVALRSRINLNPRAAVAGGNIVSAASTFTSAVVLHVRRNVWFHNMALSILRTTLELVGRAMFVALSTGNQAASRWNRGAQIAPRDWRAFVDHECAGRWAYASPAPSVVYEWLCEFTHFNARAVKWNHDTSDERVSHEWSYAALAYLSWFVSAGAEVVTGDTLARWPAAWPDHIPWA